MNAVKLVVIVALFDVVLGLIVLGIGLAVKASADPGQPCAYVDARLCSPGSVAYCPDTATVVTWLAPCPTLQIGGGVLGPSLPTNGGQR